MSGALAHYIEQGGAREFSEFPNGDQLRYNHGADVANGIHDNVNQWIKSYPLQTKDVVVNAPHHHSDFNSGCNVLRGGNVHKDHLINYKEQFDNNNVFDNQSCPVKRNADGQNFMIY